MKALKTFFILALVAAFTIPFQGSVNNNSGDENTGVNTSEPDISQKVTVRVTIGKGGCSGGFGICRIIIRAKSEGNSIENLGANEFIATATYSKSSFKLSTSRELMKESTHNQYFSGGTFVMEEDYTVEKNSINNKKEFTLKAGTYNIESNQSFEDLLFLLK